MSNGKYLRIDDATGLIEELEALSVSTGVSDASKPVKTDSNGLLDLSLMPVGIGPDTVDLVCSENLSAGNAVNIYDNGGVPTCRLADRTNNRPANGFVLQNFTSGQTAKVYKDSKVTGMTGLTNGAVYFLGASGAISTTPPVAGSGHICQVVGLATSATVLDIEIARPIKRG
jgi:hypothetical protein